MESTRNSSADTLVIPNDQFLQEVEKVIASGETVMLTATGNSMLPFITGGRDTVFLKSAGKLELGQIVLARLSEGNYVLHRIIKISEEEIILRGDGNLCATEECTTSDIVGIVWRITRNGKTINPDSRSERCRSRLWMWLLPVRRYLLFIYKRTHKI